MSDKHQLLDSKIAEIFSDTDRLTEILQSGIDDALLKHKQAGNPVCEWRDGKVVWIQPEDIPVRTRKQPEKG
ncbi:MAG: hypothetical protein V3V61_04220 [Gammaproteobacteria bacterium]